MNKVFIVGRLTRDPEHRTTPNGVSVTTFSVAVTRRMNRDEADYLNVVAWRGLADTCSRYLVKGQQVAVCGEIRTRSYEAKDGSKRYVTEIQADDVEFLARPGAAGGAPAGGRDYAPRAAEPASERDMFASEMNDVLVDDEELPF
ncbi:MAG: single-stranded DNA-binding protein [Christensenellaceae bacterium]|nr:single-stranded DNA-binding protein [Christensenellaceae bacterium]